MCKPLFTWWSPKLSNYWATQKSFSKIPSVVVGGISLVTILLLAALFCSACSLGCLSSTYTVLCSLVAALTTILRSLSLGGLLCASIAKAWTDGIAQIPKWSRCYHGVRGRSCPSIVTFKRQAKSSALKWFEQITEISEGSHYAWFVFTKPAFLPTLSGFRAIISVLRYDMKTHYQALNFWCCYSLPLHIWLAFSSTIWKNSLKGTREMCETQILEFSIWRHSSHLTHAPKTQPWGQNGGVLAQFYKFRQGVEN